MNIYLLIDPNSLEVRYVGRSKNVERRYKIHLSLAKRNKFKHLYVYNWIRTLLNTNQKPLVKIIESDLSMEEAIDREDYWIEHYRKLGNITNLTKNHVPMNSSGKFYVRERTPLNRNPLPNPKILKSWTFLEVEEEAISLIKKFAKDNRYTLAGALNEVMKRVAHEA